MDDDGRRTGGGPPRPPNPSGLFALRFVLIGIGVVIGVALIISGRTLFGLLLLAMAALRISFVVRMRRFRRDRVAYREEMQARRRGRPPT